MNIEYLCAQQTTFESKFSNRLHFMASFRGYERLLQIRFITITIHEQIFTIFCQIPKFVFREARTRCKHTTRDCSKDEPCLVHANLINLPIRQTVELIKVSSKLKKIKEVNIFVHKVVSDPEQKKYLHHWDTGISPKTSQYLEYIVMGPIQYSSLYLIVKKYYKNLVLVYWTLKYSAKDM